MEKQLSELLSKCEFPGGSWFYLGKSQWTYFVEIKGNKMVVLNWLFVFGSLLKSNANVYLIQNIVFTSGCVG